MYICIYKERDLQKERERGRGGFEEISPHFDSRRTNIGRFVGRKLDAVPDRGTKERADKRGPVTEIGRRSGLGMEKVREEGKGMEEIRGRRDGIP